MSNVRAEYMMWAKMRPHLACDLAGSNLMPCSIEELPGAGEALRLGGIDNDNGYPPLVAAIAARYRVRPENVATGTGTSGVNFLACAAMLEPGDEVLVERPGYDPLLAAPRLLGARVTRFDRRFEDGWALDPDRIRAAITPHTGLIVITNLHNPTGVLAGAGALREIGLIAEQAGAYVLADEVYLDALFEGTAMPSATLGERFISTSSLTKSYGLAGLRCGWALAAPDVAERIRRARDIVDGSGAAPAESLAVHAFAQIDRLAARARGLLAGNFRRLRAFIDERPELEWIPPAGGTVAFPRLRGVGNTEPFAARLAERHETAIVPGRFFEAPAHVRLSFGGRPDVLVRGLEAIGHALDRGEHLE
jgi:hypothetical protein